MAMSERDARTVLFVRAVEETDREGALLSPSTRAAATRRALDEARDPTDRRSLLRARASLLHDEILGEVPALGRVIDPPRRGGGLVLATLAVATIAGLATNLLGPSRHVSVLAFPLAGILAWNLAVYAGLAARTIARAVARGRRTATAGRGLASLGLWLEAVRPSSLARRLGAGARSAAVAAAVERFQRLWMRTAAPLVAARLQVVLHLAAFSLALGAILGLYVSGIAFEYRATWESTWLDTGAVQRYVDLTLGPAAAVLGTSVPDVAALRGPAGAALPGSGGEGDAAPWIHLWATTLALFVVVPRLGLALAGALTVARLSRRLRVDLDDAYYRRTLAGGRGSAAVVEVVYYSCAPTARLRERLHVLLQALVGARAAIRDGPRLDYGDGPDRVTWTDETTGPGLLVLVFPLAQTPEPEVHGEFLEQLQQRIDRAGGRMVVLLETGTYRTRVSSEERVRERRATWERLLRDLGLTAAELDETAATDDGAVDRWIDAAGQAVWSGRSSGRTA
jgi:hypothetical protein